MHSVDTQVSCLGKSGFYGCVASRFLYVGYFPVQATVVPPFTWAALGIMVGSVYVPTIYNLTEAFQRTALVVGTVYCCFVSVTKS